MPGDDIQKRIDRSHRILEAAPDNHLARFGLATALLEGGRWEEAAVELRRCLERQPDWMAAAIHLGRCLVMTGCDAEAREVLAAAREMAIRQGHTGPLEEIADLEARCR